jgi:hypothetical protein
VRASLILAVAGSSVALLAVLPSGGASGEDAGTAQTDAESNPCLGPDAKLLRCPDLQMRRPDDLYAEHTARGHVVLQSKSDIKSRGEGPIELHGKRIGKKTMSVTQRIYRADGSHLDVPSKGTLRFKFIPGQGGYWKFANAARFQLWSLDRDGNRKRLVQRGPKVYYCLRDLVRTRPSRRSPRSRVYPGCNQNPRKRRVTLGTSVGWSDVYPADYYEQYINVSGLRGCFAFVLVADPKDHIYESREGNNEGQRIVRLPFRHGPQRCR